MGRVLIVDDEEEAVDVLSDFFTDLGFQARTALNGEEALTLLGDEQYDLIMLDLRMPQVDGESVIKELHARGLDTQVIVMTGISDGGVTKEKLEQYKVKGYIEKPIDLNILEDIIKGVRPT